MEEGFQVNDVVLDLPATTESVVYLLDPVQYDAIVSRLDWLVGLIFLFVLIYFAKDIIVMMYKTLSAFWQG